MDIGTHGSRALGCLNRQHGSQQIKWHLPHFLSSSEYVITLLFSFHISVYFFLLL